MYILAGDGHCQIDARCYCWEAHHGVHARWYRAVWGLSAGEDAKTTAASARGCTSAPLCCALDVHVVGLAQPKHASIRGSSLNLLRGSDPPADQAAAKKQPTGTAKPKTTLVIGKSTWEGEPPTKVFEKAQGGSVWLAGLPRYPTPVSITGFFAGHVLHGAPPGSVTPESGAIGEKRPRAAVWSPPQH